MSLKVFSLSTQPSVKTQSNLKGTMKTAFFFVVMILSMHEHNTAKGTDLSALQRFSEDCYSTEYLPQDKTHFSPVNRLDACKDQSQFWCYEHQTTDKRYANNTVHLQESRGANISFYSALNKPKPAGELPEYIVHLLSVPRAQGNALDGYMIRSEEAVQHGVLRRQDRSSLLNSSISIENGRIIPVNIETETETDRGKINKLWGKIVGAPALSKLVMQSRENRENNLSESYDHTFYFFEVPKNKKRHRRRRMASRLQAQSNKTRYCIWICSRQQWQLYRQRYSGTSSN